MDDLLPIGRFARLTGLSVGALRHYDELDLLRPAWVDPETGYRSYRRDQILRARSIARLRDLELPLEDIRNVLAEDDPAAQSRLLAEHRSRIAARTNRLQRILHVLHQIVEQEEPIVSITPAVLMTDPADRRRMAADLFNYVWSLLEIENRTPEQIDEMIHAAHASTFHWGQPGVGGPENRARGEWQCSRVYAVLGRPEPALWHARRCLEICEQHGIADWDIAAAYEAMARACWVANDFAGLAAWKVKAAAALETLDEGNREIIGGDLASLP